MTARLLTIPEVVARTGLARGTVYRCVADGVFVAKQRIGNSGPLLVAEATVDVWCAERDKKGGTR